jgi:hypothetical protein
VAIIGVGTTTCVFVVPENVMAEITSVSSNVARLDLGIRTPVSTERD